jgi:hypothetical protein
MAHINKIYRKKFLVFKQRFKYLKNEKSNIIKWVLKLTFTPSEYIYFNQFYFIFVEPFRLKQIQKKV